ncbi:hypothetical protein IB642_02615 [Allofrancisella guangzhouensis]|uniref:Membrane protein n=1 Tax=Allofrancisella guangzhouensis TaxID=594679 RepID=A0A0A8E5R7_9GAMM|nr:hypothetical protein [Allofrancisella guangzhouensis]AJC49358.1 membrane protein [Allofrancisella guangzhouensis]MBK2027001.1 hypothetical protein [Allofrancisella guangzhouensis]MBK2043909.1 hypothetical protein [Allofrancisella guangzhouensis]MBK2044978.1 hypothetical protein [Allofrancisella guangzhouensis]
MKKIILSILGVAVVSGVYAKDYTLYAKADEKSGKLATVNDQDPKYSAIFSKGDWIEIVDSTTGKVGWVKQDTSGKAPSTQQDPIAAMIANFQAQQKLMEENFNKAIANIDSNIAQLQAAHSSLSADKQSKAIKKFSSVTINSDGKTAKIIKKTDDGNGNLKTVEKEVPVNQLNTMSLDTIN